ncbi:hypothetical protein [Paenibacillus gorillae]|uniref:hypothetical protein n=1 Tax=Paenibacillus gorillae TaxID=1243662 RepID=UPI0005A8A161|nr:hypothetical protein [Paenibacillus gorillae]
MGLLYEMVLKKKQSALLAVAYKHINSSETQFTAAERGYLQSSQSEPDHRDGASLQRAELIQS